MFGIEAPSDTALARMRRILLLGASLTGIAFTALAAQHIAHQWLELQLPFAIVVTTLLLAAPIVLAALSWVASMRVLHVLVVANIVVYIAAVITWPIAMTVPRIPDGVQPWIINLLPMVVFSAAVIMPEAAAWVFLVLMCLAAGVLRWLADGAGSLSTPIQDTVFNATTITVFVAIVIVTLRAGRRRDDAALRTAADAVEAAASEAQDLQRARVAALTHDDVIATLLAAARSTDATTPLVRRYARRALDRMEALAVEADDPDHLVRHDEVIWAIKETAAALSPDVRFASEVSEPTDVPSDVVQAMSEATAEAVRNSLRHAGAEERSVRMRMTSGAVSVEIVDDGVGFDPRSVPPDRFGVRMSIARRMSLVTGGSATIDSRPGSGTRVRLDWSAR